MPSHPLKKNKELGQHFLVNQGVIKKIADQIDLLARSRTLIEIGPGSGALTTELLHRNYRVLAIETDERWIAELREKLATACASEQLQILHDDALRIDIEAIRQKLNSKDVMLCGNFPYNCGQQILLRFFEEADFVQSFVVMLQKEVVEKFFHAQKKSARGPLSVKCALMTEKLDDFDVSPGSFSPPPKVMSSVLSFCRKENPEFDPLRSPDLYTKFSRFLNDLFRDRRKKLRKKMLQTSVPESRLAEWGDLRAEDLSAEDFLRMFRYTQSSK